MSSRLGSTLKTAILAAMALMFYSKISSGTLGYYINARFQWLPYVALILLMAFALTLAYQSRNPGRVDSLSPDLEAVHVHQHSWWVLALMAVPVVLGLLLPARALSASAVGSRGLGGAAPARVAGAVSASVIDESKTIMDWLREFAQVGGDLPSLAGKPVDVIGFVYRDKRTTGGAFWVARYTLSCCVADATGIGMIVQSAKSDTYAEGSWVRVRGTIALSKSDGESLPMIAASLIDAVEQPDNPYLFP